MNIPACFFNFFRSRYSFLFCALAAFSSLIGAASPPAAGAAAAAAAATAAATGATFAASAAAARGRALSVGAPAPGKILASAKHSWMNSNASSGMAFSSSLPSPFSFFSSSWRASSSATSASYTSLTFQSSSRTSKTKSTPSWFVYVWYSGTSSREGRRPRLTPLFSLSSVLPQPANDCKAAFKSGTSASGVQLCNPDRHIRLRPSSSSLRHLTHSSGTV
mmetsp:Transcript_52236/g.117642  ORF Transcript_52236/g.117642 Transcript_52236/m.117642 type:complete len:220 (-) Transcript_52236:287-946(-)